MPPSEVGMPQINATAPRVMANAMLFEVDRVAESISIKNYARFMDDIDLGVDSISEAKNAVKNIDLTLQARKLRLNSSKTKILTREEAFDHFCIEENAILQRGENVIKALLETNLPLTPIKRELEKLYEKWWDRDTNGAPNINGRFRRGNGPKILKWCLRSLMKTGGVIPQEDLIWLIRNEPSLRSTAFQYLTSTRAIHSANRSVARILKSGYFIDDQALIDYSNFLINSKFSNTNKFHKELREILDMISQNNNFGAICTTNIISKYGTLDEILYFAKSIKIKATNDNWLARSVAGCAPRFFGAAAKLSDFQDIINDLDNDEAISVLNFHFQMASDPIFPKKHLPYLKKENPSFHQNIYYPKVLMCLSLKNNPHFKSDYSLILSTHTSLTSDPFHKAMGF